MAYGSIVAMYKKTAIEGNMYYVHTDHLASVNCVTDYMKHGFCKVRTKPDVELIPTGTPRREGNSRDPARFENLNSAFQLTLSTSASPAVFNETFHLQGSAEVNGIVELIPLRNESGKHMDEFGLINMNGRTTKYYSGINEKSYSRS